MSDFISLHEKLIEFICEVVFIEEYILVHFIWATTQTEHQSASWSS